MTDKMKFPRRSDSELRQRILAKISIDARGCWNMPGGTLGDGYAALWDGSRQTLAHRTSHEVFIGPIPDGLNVLHRCDNRRCANPEHFFTGTQGQNMADMVAKGRSLRGDRNPLRQHPERAARRHGIANAAAKLLPGQVEAIRRATGVQYDIAAAFGINQSQVSRIKSGDRRAHG